MIGITTVKLAFDRSTRWTDEDGRLHVGVSNISKAAINPYHGREIPRCEELGLNPDGVYYLFRDPEELAKSAHTFNNLQILSKHVPVSAWDDESHMAELTVGSLGTDCVWKDPYLQNSLVVWAAPAIAGVESRDQQELSASYRYDAVMDPGTYKGLHYDGRMTNIRGNHVALVESGRAGPDVVVGDSQFEGPIMLRSRTALLLSGALAGALAPRLAQDHAIDFSKFAGGVTRANFKRTTADLPARVVRALTPKLAQDEGVDVDDVIKIIAAVEGGVAATEADVIDDTPAIDDDGGDVVGKICALLEGKVDDETLASIRAMGGTAADEFPDKKDDDKDDKDDKKDKDKPAMDRRTVERIAADARTAASADFRALREAEKDVFPHVGEVVAMDSASDVYGFALEQAGIDLTGIPKSGYKAMLKALPAPGADRQRVAMDADPSALSAVVRDAPRLKRVL